MFQDNVDYDAWGAWLKQQLKEYGILDGLVLDLGCGTGTMTELLAEAGYDMIGVTIPRKCWQRPWRSVWSPDTTFFIFCRICRSLNYTEP